MGWNEEKNIDFKLNGERIEKKSDFGLGGGGGGENSAFVKGGSGEVGSGRGGIKFEFFNPCSASYMGLCEFGNFKIRSG